MLARCVNLAMVALLAGMPVILRAEDDRNTIRWVSSNIPPKHIHDGPLRGMGYGEQQMTLLAASLPQFQHRREQVTPARMWHEMKTGRGVCAIDIADLPEREAWAVFTRHTITLPSYQMLLLRERLPEFSDFRAADGSIDLDRLAASDRLTGIYVGARHYMPEISAFIGNGGRRTRMEPVRDSDRIFEMVSSRHADFSFAMPIEMNYANALAAAQTIPSKKPPAALIMLPIKGATQPVLGHIACSRDPLGQQVVAAIDRLLDDEIVWSQFLAPLHRWTDG
jgi:uncharacterized protein (TIGR02285 family)